MATFWTSSLLVLSLTSLVNGQAYKCTDFVAPIVVTAPFLKPNFSPFQNNSQSVAFGLKATNRNVDSNPALAGNPTDTTVTFRISARYCTPLGASTGTLQVLTHGLGFDKAYWDFGGPSSEYNYIRSATAAGYSTLSYDRIGTGASTKPDPYTMSQTAIELALLKKLTVELRAGTLHSLVPKATGNVVHIGHSYGSILSNALVASSPELSDGVVLTGYSTTAEWIPQWLISTNFVIAAGNQPHRFGQLSTGYLTWNNEFSNQLGFFYYPNFDPAILAAAEAAKFPFAVGEVLTAGSYVGQKSGNFTGPVMVSIADTARRRSSLTIATDHFRTTRRCFL